ncbi:AarF/ABC1/UbiB kinase family protein [Microbacterium sp. X-17]|uniref:ABC1 kinase family protein n=1 Tax=Microbacterium sp. X-17 TaxID=3144404 RepID=UPI0031F4BFD5
MRSHAARYQEIAETLARHGLASLLDAAGLRFGNPRAAEHVRLALEELGPTFVKLGQVLSTRPDLIPEPFLTELAKLQDGARPVPAEEIHDVIRLELGADPADLFAWFQSEPLASASIGQAHLARLPDGTDVVVKVRRPGAVEQVEGDLEILRDLADRASRTWKAARAYDLRGLVQEFSRTLRAELDYVQEGRNAERFATNFARRPGVRIPRIFWDLTTPRVLTLERMSGMKITDLTALDEAGVDRKALAKSGATIMLQMIFDDRFFHADPHPGNLFVAPSGSISLIDFGMVGEVADDLADHLTTFLVAFTFQDPDALTASVLDLSATKGSIDREALHDGIVSFVSEYEGRPLREIGLTRLAPHLFSLFRAQHLQLPREIALIFKVLVVIEGIGVRLDPDFDLFAVLRPFVQQLLQKQMSFTSVARRLAQASTDAGGLLLELPGHVRRLLAIAETSGVDVHLRAAELEPLMRRAERIGDRVVAGMIAAALIGGVGDLVAGGKRWRSWRSALMGAGIAGIGTLLGYLLWTERRRPR